MDPARGRPNSIGPGREFEIYQGGLRGQRPETPVALSKLEQRARDILAPEAYDYVAGSAGGERTALANLEAFGRWRIVPRMLRDVSQRDLSARVLGLTLPAPVLLAPVGVQGILHAQAELAPARAAASLGLPFVLSTLSSRSIEEVAQAMGPAPRWFQLYWGEDRELTASMIARAEKWGYSAIVVTLDTAMLGWRPRDLDHAFLPFLGGEGLANYFSDPVFRSRLARPPEDDVQAAVRLWTTVLSNPTLTWPDLNFLREHTRVPILLKGILHPDDAQLAVEHGAAGVIVSNHGGRQVDGCIAALDALPAVIERIGGRIPVLFDSGIRCGADVFKAVALGASAVLLGRPYVWALAAGGEQGVREALLNLLAETDISLALSGYRSFAELGPSALVRTE